MTDGDIEEAKRLLRVPLAEYGQAIADGKEALLHRVCHRLFRAGSCVRIDMEKFLAGTEPIWRYPHLYIALLEYALMPMVERRIEAVHARIKRLGNVAFGAGLPYVCAAIRNEHNLKLLKSSAEFMALACREWRGRKLCDKVLHLRYSPAELKDKNFHDKVLMIYQTGIAQEFADTTEPRTNLAEFRIMTSSARVQFPKPVEPVWQSAVFLKSLLESTRFVSLPRDLFAMSQLPSPMLPAVPTNLKPDITAIHVSLDVAQQIQFNDSVSCIFQVVNNTPENRVLVKCHHVEGDHRFRVMVHVFNALSSGNHEGSNKIVVQLDAEASVVAIDLRPLVLHIERTLREGALWRVRRSTTQPTLRPLPDELAPALSTALVPASAPGAVEAIVPLAPRRFALLEEDETAIVLRELSAANAFVASGAAMSEHADALGDVSDLTINTLVERGAVRATLDASGSRSLALVPVAVDWRLTHGLDHPLPLVRCTSSRKPLQKTKLELAIALECDGWTSETGAIAPATQDGRRHYTRAWHKPLSYFACLHDASDVFGKGGPSIKHDGPSSYYKCLLLLDGEDLGEALLALENMNEKECKRVLKDREIDSSSCSDDAPIDDEHLPLPDIHIPMHAGSVVAPSDLWNRCEVAVPGMQSIKVYFDHFTSGGKSQKGYAVCSACGITRWKVCGGSRARYCASMIVWQANCAAIGGRPADHRAWDPPDTEVDAALAHCQLTDFYTNI